MKKLRDVPEFGPEAGEPQIGHLAPAQHDFFRKVSRDRAPKARPIPKKS